MSTKVIITFITFIRVFMYGLRFCRTKGHYVWFATIYFIGFVIFSCLVLSLQDMRLSEQCRWWFESFGGVTPCILVNMKVGVYITIYIV